MTRKGHLSGMQSEELAYPAPPENWGAYYRKLERDGQLIIGAGRTAVEVTLELKEVPVEEIETTKGHSQ